MQTARVLKAVDSRTGNITLHGAARDRVAQAAAAGLIAEDIRADVEAVRRENARLRREMAIERACANERKRALNAYRRERLAGYLAASEADMRRAGMLEMALGWWMLGVAVGGAVVTIAVVLLI